MQIKTKRWRKRSLTNKGWFEVNWFELKIHNNIAILLLFFNINIVVLLCVASVVHILPSLPIRQNNNNYSVKACAGPCHLCFWISSTEIIFPSDTMYEFCPSVDLCTLLLIQLLPLDLLNLIYLLVRACKNMQDRVSCSPFCPLLRWIS